MTAIFSTSFSLREMMMEVIPSALRSSSSVRRRSLTPSFRAAEGRFPDGRTDLLTELRQGLGKPDGGRGLSLLCRGGSDEDELSVGVVLHPLLHRQGDRGLVFAVEFKVALAYAEFLGNWPELRARGNLCVARYFSSTILLIQHPHGGEVKTAVTMLSKTRIHGSSRSSP
jgi:hypothetical protein